MELSGHTMTTLAPGRMQWSQVKKNLNYDKI